MVVKMRTHKEMHDDWMKDPLYAAAYEEELRKELRKIEEEKKRTEEGTVTSE